jgi:hypothetical protein
MKKLILLVILGIGIFCAFSCTKSCTCDNPKTGEVHEIEVSPSENCSSHSTVELGSCS